MYIKKLNENAKVPTRGSKGAAGYDLYACTDGEEIVIPPYETKKIHTGIAVAVPNNHFGAIFARSGIAVKKSLRPANAVGVIDEDYTGEIMVALHNDSGNYQTISDGERIAQLVIIPYRTESFEVVDNLDETERGVGGFGSTGA